MILMKSKPLIIFTKLPTLVKAGIFGAVLGLILSLSYIGTSIWLCSSLISCPIHWFPFVIIGLLIWMATMLSSILAAIALRNMFRYFDVSDRGR